jgi:hypothetical protein
MDSRLLIDSIVRQTTVLLAHLSTAAGLRAPLANVADQVFVQLAREIESQGVGRKVAADMFGLALRTYQRKVQRLGEEVAPGQSLFQAILSYLEESGSASRQKLIEKFSSKDEVVVMAVVNDLVSSGLVYRTGRGPRSVVGLVPDADLTRLARNDEGGALEDFVWLAVFKEPGMTERAFAERFGDRDAVHRALAVLVADGRVQRVERAGETVLESGPFVVPVGATRGWEAAVFDHFQAVTTAIMSKLRNIGPRSVSGELIGGTTVHFGIHDAHPHRDEVLGSLERVRAVMEVLREKVTQYNLAHPVPEEERTRVTFYFGQSMTPPGEVLEATWGDAP